MITKTEAIKILAKAIEVLDLQFDLEGMADYDKEMYPEEVEAYQGLKAMKKELES